MSTDMTRDEKVQALVRVTGMPERRAEFIIDGQTANGSATAIDAEPAVAIELPFSVTVPWSCLVSDNDRTTPIIVQHQGKTIGRTILTERYKTARRAIHTLLSQQLAGRLPVAFPVELHARVFVPDKRPHDCPDFSKGVHDAMARQVFTNDAWVYRAIWERAGVDVDRPRVDITVRALLLP